MCLYPDGPEMTNFPEPVSKCAVTRPNGGWPLPWMKPYGCS
jgi:hypothetical protein